MNEITLILTDHERTRLWLALIDAADKAQSDAADMARTDEERDVCEDDAELVLRVATELLLSTHAPSGDAA